MCWNFTAEPLCSLRRTDEPLKRRNSCLRLRPRSVFGSFGVVLMSCKVNFHVVRSGFQNSACLLIVTRKANLMLWRKGTRQVWFTSGVIFAITRISRHVPCCHSSRGGGGGVLNKFLYGEAPTRCPTPYPLVYHFSQKRYPFPIPIDIKGLFSTAIDKWSLRLRGARPARVFHRWVQTQADICPLQLKKIHQQ